jgi:hypothetical protein
MKITIAIDATPAEVRESFGLPDLKPLQEDIVQTLRDNMQKGMQGLDPMTLMASVWPPQMQTLQTMQKVFWDNLTKTMTGQTPEEQEPAKHRT